MIYRKQADGPSIAPALFLWFFCALGATAIAAEPNAKTLVPFKVTAQSGQLISILVAKGTSDAQLTDLVVAIGCAKIKKNMRGLGLPRTTPGAPSGDYVGVGIGIFDDPVAASEGALRRWQKLDIAKKGFEAEDQKYTRNMKAHYEQGGRGPHMASLAYDTKSPHYKAIPIPGEAACPVLPLSGEQAAKVAEKNRAEDAARAAEDLRFGKRPIQSGFTGSYSVVEEYLLRKMNDPDSLKMDACTKVARNNDGWLVGCPYRGKNGFGALVRQFSWFTIRQDRVINVEPESTYAH